MRKLGSWSAIETKNDENAPWVILFHGYGADAGDLAPLADLIPTQKPWNFLFPQAPLEVPIGPGWTGRAWWNIDMARIQRDAEQGIERDTSLESPPSLPKIRESAMDMITRMGVPWERIVLGGFSQGGMLAVDVALHAPESPLGLAILSSALINKEAWKAKAPQRAGLPFYQSHGQQDVVLAHKNAQRLETLLTQGGLKGSLRTFRGGHEIPMPVLQELGQYLDRIAP